MNDKHTAIFMQSCFPLERLRPAQATALDFIGDCFEKDYRDVVISAPTGTGKSGIGAAVGLWSSTQHVTGYQAGSYYLVTQKLLQDQLENDMANWTPTWRNQSGSLKSSADYPCSTFASCMAGALASKNKGVGGATCQQRADKSCPYTRARIRFEHAALAVTNYPYLFTEHTYLDSLDARNVLIGDECHTLERQILGFVDIAVTPETVLNWAPTCLPVPCMESLFEFKNWLLTEYLVCCKSRLEALAANLAASRFANLRIQTEYNQLGNHISRIEGACTDIENEPDAWVYWQEVSNKSQQWCSYAKPLSAAPFRKRLLDDMGSRRVYMSAYPGPKSVFCRSLGLNEKDVAWLELDSDFPVSNRPIHLTTIGSMGRKNAAETLPRLLAMCETILGAYPLEKGIIHCHSYALGQEIYNYLKSKSCGNRVLFASRAEDRKTNFTLHRTTELPTVILSPSVSEGYSFDDDLARFQIIAKVPYPYLGDRQVAAKMEQDRDWYTMQTIMGIIQACGRIVRSATDHGDTYILDHDFVRLYEENPTFFPAWFSAALHFYR